MDNHSIRTENISKNFGNIQALRNVNFEVKSGEIMALVGDNGAGKSTLAKILSGVFKPTSGDIFLRDERVSFDSYNNAQKKGIRTVYQDLALAPKQSVAANVFLGNEPIREEAPFRFLRIVDRVKMRDRAREVLENINIPIDPSARTENLSGGQRQAVAIARALKSDPDILILDEPTSALSVEGVENIQNVITDLNKQGQTIMIISHNLREVMTVADRIAVLARGELVGIKEADAVTRDEVIAMMMGEQLTEQS